VDIKLGRLQSLRSRFIPLAAKVNSYTGNSRQQSQRDPFEPETRLQNEHLWRLISRAPLLKHIYDLSNEAARGSGSTTRKPLAFLRKSVASRSQPKPLPRLAAVETLQREQDLTRLPPKRGLIAAQPVERIGRQVGQADIGACEIVERICRLSGR